MSDTTPEHPMDTGATAATTSTRRLSQSPRRMLGRASAATAGSRKAACTRGQPGALVTARNVTTANTPVTFDVRANDMDVDGNALTVTHIDGTPAVVNTPIAVTGGTVTALIFTMLMA